MVLTTINPLGSGSSRTAIPPANGTLSTPGLSSMRSLSASAGITALAITRMAVMSLTASCAPDRCTSLTSACLEIRQRTELSRFSVPGPSPGLNHPLRPAFRQRASQDEAGGGKHPPPESPYRHGRAMSRPSTPRRSQRRVPYRSHGAFHASRAHYLD
jgi:hypothetical protein